MDTPQVTFKCKPSELTLLQEAVACYRTDLLTLAEDTTQPPKERRDLRVKAVQLEELGKQLSS